MNLEIGSGHHCDVVPVIMWIFLQHVFVIMLIAFGIDKDTVQHSTPLKQKQRCNSLCRVSTSVPFETVGVHPKTLPKSIIIVFFLSSSSYDFLLVFVFRQCHYLHCLINSAQQINYYIFLFTQIWDKFAPLDLTITTG